MKIWTITKWDVFLRHSVYVTSSVYFFAVIHTEAFLHILVHDVTCSGIAMIWREDPQN